ncbi:GNAT family N-acetyltransferase [Kitasatospora terrestris]|uniref:Lysine N-acyltransferase MbtK n=1 Tax=Kitasatospora terrestris TaxID=258051 RepID=A0ABP9DQG0_9ACTN
MSHRVFRDAHGIPHLRADGPRGLAFAQGHNAAADRAWQLEVERHRAQGGSAAFLGPEAFSWDVLARRVRLADTARRCFAALDRSTAGWVLAYVDGVNAGLAEHAGHAPEFAAAGVRPGEWKPWTPLAVWLSHHLLFAGFPAKLWRERVARELGPDAVELFATDGPGSSGSNGWLLAGGRTATGAALIAGDPHRFIEAPGVYQQIRLACPEYDVVGLAVPGVPGLAHFGHTGGVAWAITNAMADYQDLYRERLRRTGDGVEALGPDGWRPAHAHTETVHVAGGDPVTVEVLETARGPVLTGGPDGEAVSLRYPPRVRAKLGFEALPALLRARTVADVDRAMDHWAEPVNVVLAADTAGGLLHRTAGAVPLRDPANGLGPVPGWDAAYAWRGWRAPLREPVDGRAVMANQRGIAAPLGVEFSAPHRARRIAELLDARQGWTADTVAAVHTDTHLGSAGPLLDLVAGLDGLTPSAAALRTRLLGWDRTMAADSADAAAYAALRAAVVRELADHPVFAGLAALPELPEALLPWQALLPRIGHALESLLTTDRLPALDRPALVRAALEQVAAGPLPGSWAETHRLAPWQALPAPAEWPGLGGDHDCVLSTSSVPGLTDLSARGPAARYVWDLADRANSRWVVPFGASGLPGHPHHRDQLPLWLAGRLAPVTTDWNQLTEEPSAMTDFRRTVPGFGEVRLRPLDPVGDAELVHGWVTQERARFWGMLDHDRAAVQETYAYVDSLTTHHAYLALRDGEPVALFQTYRPEHDPVGGCYPVLDGDHGVHLLIGPADGEARPGFTEALIAVLIAFVLDDPAHRRIVAEPDARNEKALSRLVRSGFELGPEIDKPEKRARLAFLTREAAAPVLARLSPALGSGV